MFDSRILMWQIFAILKYSDPHHVLHAHVFIKGIFVENTDRYLARLQLLYLDVCWGKNTFSSLPLSISAFIQAD